VTFFRRFFRQNRLSLFDSDYRYWSSQWCRLTLRPFSPFLFPTRTRRLICTGELTGIDIGMLATVASSVAYASRFSFRTSGGILTLAQQCAFFASELTRVGELELVEVTEGEPLLLALALVDDTPNLFARLADAEVEQRRLRCGRPAA